MKWESLHCQIHISMTRIFLGEIFRGHLAENSAIEISPSISHLVDMIHSLYIGPVKYKP